MNVIVFTKRRGASRQIDLLHPKVAAKISGVAVLVCGLLFGIGFVTAAKLTKVDPDVRSQQLLTTIDAQRAELDVARRQAEDNLQAIATRVGQMRAHVIRLDALGRRLTKMANLEDGEFNFGQLPAQGGPELSIVTNEITSVDFLGGLSDLDAMLADRGKQLGVLENLLLDRNLQEQIHPQGRPLKSGWISSFFGVRDDPFTGRKARHEGVDYAGKQGSEIIAVAAGVVTWSSDRFGYGNMVEIDHGNGYVTRYAHNQVNLVAVGDKVAKGQVVALMGSTGRATGPNLHFEVHYKARPVDPLKFIRSQRG